MASDTKDLPADEETVEQPSEELALLSLDNLPGVIAGMTELDSASSLMETKARIVAEMLAAETEEQLWTELPTWSSKHNVGKTFQITAVRGVFQGRFEDPDTGTKGGFIACSAVAVDGANPSPDENGEIGEPSPAGTSGILSTSALRLAGRIGWYHMHDKLPVTLTIVKRGETAQGYPILDAELVK